MENNIDLYELITDKKAKACSLINDTIDELTSVWEEVSKFDRENEMESISKIRGHIQAAEAKILIAIPTITYMKNICSSNLASNYELYSEITNRYKKECLISQNNSHEITDVELYDVVFDPDDKNKISINVDTNVYSANYILTTKLEQTRDMITILICYISEHIDGDAIRNTSLKTINILKDISFTNGTDIVYETGSDIEALKVYLKYINEMIIKISEATMALLRNCDFMKKVCYSLNNTEVQL